MLDPRRRACLRAMGIDVWVERAAAKKEPGSISSSREIIEPGPFFSAASEELDVDPFIPADPICNLDWDPLRSTVSGCRACGLCETRTQTVFGTGAHDADLMIIGEAPGAEEDRQGEPFVGRAGQLLNAMLAAIGLERSRVYIANIVKCRPPGNRDPHAEEAAACRPYLLRQVALLQPRLILSVGRVSAQNLLGSEEPVGRLRGRVHRFEPGDIPLIVTYHPAYLLRKPSEKAKAWQDMQAAHRVLHSADNTSNPDH
jgi:DNA polymerase